MRPEIIQARLVFKGVGALNGEEVVVVCTKTLVGVKDALDEGTFDYKSRYTFESITPNREFKLSPVYFPFKQGFQYSLEQVIDLCIANDYDAWLCENTTAIYLTDVAADFLITEDDEYLITEDEFNLTTE